MDNISFQNVYMTQRLTVHGINQTKEEEIFMKQNEVETKQKKVKK